MAEQIDVLFTGSVQGVGFRYTAIRTAGGFDVAGFVTNLPDGRVQIVAEGETAELTAFLAAVEEAMGGYITARQIHRRPAGGAFVRFGVR